MFAKRHVMVVSAMLVALATVLSFIKYPFFYGGSITACSMLFVIFVGYYFGSAAGIVSAIVYGLIQFILDPYFVHPVQLLLDYLLGFGFLGISGFFSKSKHGLYKGIAAGMSGRLICSIISGIVFFADYAPEGTPVYVYSTLYNAGYIIPEMVITILLISIPAFSKAINSIKAKI